MDKDFRSMVENYVRDELSVSFGVDDLEAEFKEYGIEPTEENITKFMDRVGIYGFREVLIQDWFERMHYLIADVMEE